MLLKFWPEERKPIIFMWNTYHYSEPEVVRGYRVYKNRFVVTESTGEVFGGSNEAFNIGWDKVEWYYD